MIHGNVCDVVDSLAQFLLLTLQSHKAVGVATDALLYTINLRSDSPFYQIGNLVANVVFDNVRTLPITE